MKEQVYVKLSGQTVFNYEGIVEIKGDPPAKAMAKLGRAIYSKVDASKYAPDFSLWTPGVFDVRDASVSSASPSFRATWTRDRWEIDALFYSTESQSAISPSVGGH